MSARFRATVEGVCKALGWQLDGDAIEARFENGRRQELSFRFFEFEGQELVRFDTVIGDASVVDPARLTQGLRVTYKFPHGALALKGDSLVMVDTLPVDDDAAAVEAIVRYLAETADHLESTMFGGDQH